MRWLKGLFRSRIKILEIEPVRQRFDDNIDESIRSLALHPGFQALMLQMKIQQATLKARLTNATSEPIEGLRAAQHGIYWLGWMDKQVQRAVNKAPIEPRPATSFELAAFEDAHKALQIVGEE